MMKENARKCFKCGSSRAEDPSIFLYRFPNPGKKNFQRCELWAKYCFPNGPWSSPEFQRKLFSEHRMLCHKHFEESAFINFEEKKLHRHAAPYNEHEKGATVIVPSTSEPVAGPSSSLLKDVTNYIVKEPQPGSSAVQEPQPGPSHLEPIKRRSQDVTKSTPKTIDSKQKYLYLKCRKNMKKICQLRNRVHKLKNKIVLQSLQTDDSVNVLMKKITPSLALLLQGEINNFRRKIKGRRWTKDQKITALRLYKRSPTCYRLLRRMFCLPAPSTLKKLLNMFPLRVGINKNIFATLKKFKRTLQPYDNEFVLMFDEMSIRKHLEYNNKEDRIEGFQDHGKQGRSPQIASHALVFMICGIRKKIKTPVAFYLSGSSVTADRLAVLIKEVLYHCFEAEINVSATVCDMDGVNRKALGILGATSQNPCIEIYNHSITTMFDPPHLLKCFRNLFMKYDIKHSTSMSSGSTTGKGISKWEHIQKFYQLDSMNPNFVFAPSLRQEHLNPNTKQKMRVKLAAQVLSHSVASGMYCKIAQGELPAEAITTADLVAKVDRLFDCLNSDTPDWRGGKPHSTNLTEKTPHLQLFKEMKQFFQTLEFIGCRSKPPSVEGWVWTLNAVELFWRNLTRRHPSIKSLATRRLQQDPIENLFGCIRSHCGSNTNPTAAQFIAGLKTAILSSLTNAPTEGNCEDDKNIGILDNYKMLFVSRDECPVDPSFDPLSDIEQVSQIGFEDSMREVDGEIQACAYVCGFIIKNLCKKVCDSCKKNLVTSDVELEHNFINMKEYSDVKMSLIYASKEVIQCVEHCASFINKYLEINAHTNQLKKNIVNSLMDRAIFDFCKCTLHKEYNIKYLTTSTFHICTKRFCTLKNRKFTEEASTTALRKKINILKHQ